MAYCNTQFFACAASTIINMGCQLIYIPQSKWLKMSMINDQQQQHALKKVKNVSQMYATSKTCMTDCFNFHFKLEQQPKQHIQQNQIRSFN